MSVAEFARIPIGIFADSATVSIGIFADSATVSIGIFTDSATQPRYTYPNLAQENPGRPPAYRLAREATAPEADRWGSFTNTVGAVGHILRYGEHPGVSRHYRVSSIRLALGLIRLRRTASRTGATGTRTGTPGTSAPRRPRERATGRPRAV